MPSSVYDIFKKYPKLDDYLAVKNGMSTTDNNRFLRFWYEVELNDISFDSSNRGAAYETGLKWFPYNKGGEFRKWYGNMIYVCNWQHDGKEIRKNAEGASGGRIVSEEYYFNSSISWSKVSAGQFSLRYYEAGYLFDVAGPSIFGDDNKRYWVLGLCNSSLKKYLLESISPTMNYERGQVAQFPIKENLQYFSEVNNMVVKNIELSKNDWDFVETSWGFKKHPLI